MIDKQLVELLESGCAIVIDISDTYYMDCYRRIVRVEDDLVMSIEDFCVLMDTHEIDDVLEPGEWGV